MSDRQSIQVSVVVPAFNEAERIGDTLCRTDDFLRARGGRYEIVVVDDGSDDHTVAVVESYAAERPAIRCIPTRPNRGKGHAVRVGMLAARGAVRLMCDADGSMPPGEMPRLLEPVLGGRCDVAIGSRYVGGHTSARPQPWWRRAWSRLANAVVQKTLVPGIEDTQCGFKAFSAHAADALFSRARIDGWAFDLEVLALASRIGFRVEERAVRWVDDDRSRVRPLRDVRRVVGEWWAIRDGLRRGVYGELRPALPLPPSASMSFPALARVP